MRIKPTLRRGGVVVELGPDERQLPAETVPMMFTLQRVLVPVDFSECSKKALQYPIPFASQFGAEILALDTLNLLDLQAQPEIWANRKKILHKGQNGWW